MPQAPVAPGAPSTPALAIADTWDIHDVREDPLKSYYFAGARYRGTIIPKFILNLFVNEGATFYSNTIGLEVDMRKDNFSIVPSLSYTEYGTDDVLFAEKNKDQNFAGNWGVVNSSLKGIFVNSDFLWSTKISPQFDFEYGVGVGIGAIFGDLGNNWIFKNPAGKYTASDGTRYAPCSTEQDGTGCKKAEHSGADVAKVGGYVEKNWLNGGAVPVLFPHISFPQIGIRYKPIKQFQARLGLGFSLTGFWFGLSGDYGFEKKPPRGLDDSFDSKHK